MLSSLQSILFIGQILINVDVPMARDTGGMHLDVATTIHIFKFASDGAEGTGLPNAVPSATTNLLQFFWSKFFKLIIQVINFFFECIKLLLFLTYRVLLQYLILSHVNCTDYTFPIIQPGMLLQPV